MKFRLYLAWDGIRKNKRLYFPYMLTCIAMVMIYYIILALSVAPNLRNLYGGETVQSVLSLGSVVIAVFSVIFLFYTNSFLMRRRKREFGLYNVLGMGKWNIGSILFWETVLVAVGSLLIGLGLGMLLSKVFELGLIRLIRGEIHYALTISAPAMGQTAEVFGVLFLLLFLNGLRQIKLTNSAMLLQSESAGEKPPRANWLFGSLGAVILGGAYYIAVSITNPVEALLWFFVAVIMVILATYLLFVSGSVVLCRFLQKCKDYYYKANHFVSVSSMTYRMKRNGAGLASICILVTMVLVMLSSTVCLYIGQEDVLRMRYPRDLIFDFYMKELQMTDSADILRASMNRTLQGQNVAAEDVLEYRLVSIAGALEESTVETDVTKVGGYQMGLYSRTVLLRFLPLEDYNRIADQPEILSDGEVLIYSNKAYQHKELHVLQGPRFQIKKVLKEFPLKSEAMLNAVTTIIVVVPDLEVLSPLMRLADYNGDRMLQLQWRYLFNLSVPNGEEVTLRKQLYSDLKEAGGSYAYFTTASAQEARQDYYSTFGGLLFLGLMLSAVFIAAAVLIIYYKQICEGYEDQARFGIMQKVGMTRREIRKSVNSQMLTVFFAPLAAAGIHLCFAFPMVQKILLAFNLTNVSLLVITTGTCFGIFALFYTVIYRQTSNAYFAIVSRE